MQAELSDTEEQGLALVARAEDLQVIDQTTLEAANALLQAIKGYLGEVDKIMDPIVSAAYQAHKTAVGQKKLLTTKAEEAEQILKYGEGGTRSAPKAGSMAYYANEQQRKIDEAHAAAAAAQRAAEAEARRLAAEEETRLRVEAETKRAAAAEAARAAGNTIQAKVIAETPVVVAPVTPPAVVVFTPPPPPAPKVQGSAFTTTYDFEIEDEGKIPREYLIPDLKKIGGVVKALKDHANIPGIKVIKGTGVRK